MLETVLSHLKLQSNYSMWSSCLILMYSYTVHQIMQQFVFNAVWSVVLRKYCVTFRLLWQWQGRSKNSGKERSVYQWYCKAKENSYWATSKRFLQELQVQDHLTFDRVWVIFKETKIPARILVPCNIHEVTWPLPKKQIHWWAKKGLYVTEKKQSYTPLKKKNF